MEQGLDEDIQHFWEVAFEIVTDMEKRLFAFLGDHDLTPPQFYVLKTLLEHHGRCRIGQIANEHHLTNATMTGLIKRLEAMQPPLVIREKSSDDGRSVDVILTDEGMTRFLAIQQNLLEQARSVLSLLPAHERREAIAKMRVYYRLLVDQFPVRNNPMPE